MFIGNKKCRIYAACGVSQTPSIMELCEEELHKELWRTYETEEDNVKFVDAAWRFLESRQREAV